MSAFDLLREQLESTKSEFKDLASEAAQAGNYQHVRKMIDQAEALDRFYEKVNALADEFIRAFRQDFVRPSSKPNPDRIPRISLAEGQSLILHGKHGQARATYDGRIWTVLRGSTVAANERESLPDNYRDLRRELRNRGDLTLHSSGTALVLERDQEFNSPSGAACFVVGYSINGNTAWIDEGTGKNVGSVRVSQRNTLTKDTSTY